MTNRGKTPIRVFSTNLTGSPEFYASNQYRVKDGIVTINGDKWDVTQDIYHAIVKYKLTYEDFDSSPPVDPGASERGGDERCQR